MKKTPVEQVDQTQREALQEALDTPADAYRERALAALRQKRFDLADRFLRTDDIEVRELVENLRVHQAELEIQNDELMHGQRQTQEALARFASLFQGLPVAGLVIDRQGLVKETNAGAQALFGLDRSYLRHHFFSRLIAECDRERVIGAWTPLAAGRSLHLTDVRFKNADAGGFIGDLHLAPLPESQDEAAHFVCVVIDRREATEQRLTVIATTERLRHSEADLQGRLRELAALHHVLAETSHADRPTEEVLRRLVEHLPAAWRFPALAEASIRLPEITLATPGFRPTQWTLRSGVPLASGLEGEIRIAYREQPPETEDLFFLDEEQTLLDTIATHVAVFLDRRHDEELLRESRENFRVLAEYSPDWEYWLGPAGGYRYVSPACARLTGYGPEAFIADPDLLGRLVHPDDRASWIRHNAKGARPQDGDRDGLEFRLLARDGQERWIENVRGPVISTDGRYLGQRGVNRDITERKRAEALAARMANLYNTSSACSQAMVRCKDEDSLLREICRIAVVLGGIKVCAIALGAPEAEDPRLVVVQGLSLEAARTLVAASARAGSGRTRNAPEGETSEYAAQLEREGLRSAAIHPLSQAGRPIGAMYFYDDDPSFFAPDTVRLLDEMSADVSFALDVIAQERASREAEAAIAEHERYLSAIFRSAQVGIGVSQGGVIREVNAYLCELLGYAREELIGRETQRLYCDEEIYQAVGRLIHAREALAETRTLETQWQRRDGLRLDVLLSASPLVANNPERGLVFTVLNMTERKGFADALQRSQDFLNATGRMAKVGGWEFYPSTRELHVTQVARELLGLPPERSLRATEAMRLVHPNDRPKLRAANQRALSAGQDYDLQIRLILDGDLEAERGVWIQLTCQPALQDGKVIKLLGAIQDISARMEADKSLRQAARVFESTAEGVIITDPHECILAVNRAFTEITGYREEEILGKTPRLLQSGRHDKRFYQALWSELKRTGLWRGEIWNRHKSGEIYPELMTISAVLDGSNELTHYVGVFRDISHIKRSEKQLEFLAHHDPLTGLPNRSLFQARLEHCLRRASRHARRVGLLFIDLDRFKIINDTLGHPIGDGLLRTVAEALAAQVRSEDTIARLGGDEFVVILEDIQTEADATLFAQRLLLTVFDQPFRVGVREIFVTASIGISVYPRDGEDIDTLLRRADIAMYQAKALGRNAFVPFDPSMDEGAADRFRLENDLRGALQRQEFLIHYQPQFGLGDLRLIGVEALCRWRHPELGMISPTTFIPLCEDIGIIDALGAWVLEESARQILAWDGMGFRVPRIAVNLSVHQLEGGGLVEQVRQILALSGIEPGRLELEVTESMIMRQPERAILALEELRSLGVTLAVDDFGTGYSSLAYLKRLPLNRLKINRSFVEHLTLDINDDAIVRAIIALGTSLGLETIAEGVETQEQADFLLRAGCLEVQGYLFGRPLAPFDLETGWADARSLLSPFATP
ncbi:EAL domain-containing protein [Thiocystis violacea]|uniref:EAL domain-containing protein n=1 Tax=Thiocystis violacea TaxID=13725 RepID=UPI001903657A|nr:EAL domain-containing protein [Thiocystis violacea]MBK1717886.1 hypothetical protein [Thiocystis violacea]